MAASNMYYYGGDAVTKLQSYIYT